MAQTRLTHHFQTAVRVPLRILTSRPALRTYITAFLLLLASLLLGVLAAAAYYALYTTVIPSSLLLHTPVHLIFDTPPSPASVRMQHSLSKHPHGIAQLPGAGLAHNTPYDVQLRITLPRTPANLAQGNFMLDLALLPDDSAAAVDPGEGMSAVPLVRSQRSGILPYRSGLVETVRWARLLPLYILGWRHEAETLTVPMLEGAVFARGWRAAPRRVSVEVRAAGERPLAVYALEVVLEARLDGLRWFMWHWRWTAFVVLAGAFWAVEVAVAIMVWGVVVLLRASSDRGGMRSERKTMPELEPKDEESEEVSDASRTYPGIGSGLAVRYSPPASRVKKEEEEEQEEEQDIKPVGLAAGTAGEADDEDEDLDDFPGGERSFDSGLGTSMESSAGSINKVRKRKGRSSPFGRERYGS